MSPAVMAAAMVTLVAAAMILLATAALHPAAYRPSGKPLRLRLSAAAMICLALGWAAPIYAAVTR